MKSSKSGRLRDTHSEGKVTYRADAYKFFGVGKIQQNAIWDRKSGFLQPCGVSQSAFVEARGSASLPKKG